MPGSIELTVDGAVATIVIDNPDQRNAMTPVMLREVAAYINSLEDRAEVRAVVLRGRGAVFSSGYAIDKIPTGAELTEIDDIDIACSAIERSRLIVIACVEGPGVGAALEVLSSCDFRFATRDAKLGITPVKLGLVYKWRGVNRLYRLIGGNFARELFLTGKLISADRAKEMGLLNDVYDGREALDEAVYAFAGAIGQLAPLALAGNKRIFYELEQLTQVAPDVAAELLELRWRVIDSRDAAEARAAFAEKRQPTFTGE